MSVNNHILIGNLGDDPAVRQTQNGGIVTPISIPTSEVWNDKSTGEKKGQTTWHRIVFFGRQAEVARDYLKKGSQVYIEGRATSSKYTDKDGIERYSHQVEARVLQMLGSKGDNQSGNNNPNGQHQQQNGYQQQEPPPPPQQDYDSDVPF